MNTDFMGFAIVGIVLVAAVGSLALWRRIVAVHEDDTLHVTAGSSVLSEQAHITHKLDVIDKWGQILTVITVLYLVAILIAYAYHHWARVL